MSPKRRPVLLPAYPLDLLERELRKIGFTKFIQSKNYEWFEVGGLKFMIAASVAPTDGPMGDSGIVIDDGETRIYDQNDSRPVDLDALIAAGPYDAHFLQYSGAIWYPMVYLYPPKMMEALGRKKRENEMARALRYATEIGASFVIPSAGPPCFLDDDLFHLNDFDRDPVNTFPDETVFLEYMAANGHDNGRLMIPGTAIELTPGACDVIHDRPEAEVAAIFTDKRAYLEAYKARQQPRIDAIKASWPRGQVDILASIKEWFEPLIQAADLTAVGINGRVLLDCDTVAVVLDFQRREVYAVAGRGVGIPPARQAGADRVGDCPPPGGLGQRPVPLLPLRGRAQGRLQRVRLQLLQVPDAGAAGVRRGLLRREGAREPVLRGGGLPHPAALPALARRPDTLQPHRGRHPDLHAARLAVRAGDREVPDLRRPQDLRPAAE